MDPTCLLAYLALFVLPRFKSQCLDPSGMILPRYQKLDCVGRGGSSKVFKVLGCNRQIYALKRWEGNIRGK